MASEKKESFLLHLEDFEDIEELKDAEAGKLIKAIIVYASNGSISENLGIQAKTMFRYIRRHIDRDTASYEEKCRKRAESGRLGGRPKKKANDSTEKQEKAKKANGFSEKQNNPDSDSVSDSDSDSVSDSVSDSDSDSVSDSEREHVAPSADGPGGGFASGLVDEERKRRISFLETMCRMYKAGAISDRDDYERWNAELDALRWGH